MSVPLLIVGGGPAGSTAALAAARTGRQVMLLERSAAPAETVCGCFLSAETIAMLRELGVDPGQMGASRIDRVRLIRRARRAEAALPFAAYGLSRRLLDAALLEGAANTGAEVRLGVTVTFLSHCNGGIAATVRGGESISAQALFLATGKHEIRGSERRPPAPPGNVALKRMYRLEPGQTQALDGAIELYLFPGGYCGLQLVENGIANLCLVVKDHVFQSRGGNWAGLIDAVAGHTPLLAERLNGATSCAGRPLAVSRIPYGFLHGNEPGACPALFRLGDQAAVIPSFSGDGLAIALWSGMAAARCWAAGGAAADYHALLRRTLSRQFHVTGLIDRIAATHLGQTALVAAGGASSSLMQWAAKRTRLAA